MPPIRRIAARARVEVMYSRLVGKKPVFMRIRGAPAPEEGAAAKALYLQHERWIAPIKGKRNFRLTDNGYFQWLLQRGINYDWGSITHARRKTLTIQLLKRAENALREYIGKGARVRFRTHPGSADRQSIEGFLKSRKTEVMDEIERLEEFDLLSLKRERIIKEGELMQFVKHLNTLRNLNTVYDAILHGIKTGKVGPERVW